MKVTLKLVCFLLAAYTTLTQVLRYLENNDASSIQLRHFHKQSQDKYPTFTFCFYTPNGNLYSTAVTELDLSKEEYYSYLKGYNVSSSSETEEKFGEVLKLDYEKFTLKPLNLFLDRFAFKTKNSNNDLGFNAKTGTIKIGGLEKDTNENEQDEIIKWAFYISHQDPDQVCFTRNTQQETGADYFRHEDVLLFSFVGRDELAWLAANTGYFRVYIHYPGHFTRSMDKPIFELLFKEMDRMRNDVSMNLPYVSILRKRSKTNSRCNLALEDDDKEFKMKVIKQVNCIPGYWASLLSDTLPLGLCETSKQLQDVYGNIQNFTGFMSSYDPPCVEMQVPVNVQQKTYYGDGKSRLSISISYLAEKYQEITNVRDFDLETLGSGIGGYIGIFLGYSLLQVSDLLDNEGNRYWRALMSICRGTMSAFAVAITYFYPKRKFILLNG